MRNQFYADWYRLRKSASFRNTIIGLIATVLLAACMVRFAGPDGLEVMLDESGEETTSAAEIAELKQDMAELPQTEQATRANAAGFADEMAASNFLAFFFLPLAVTIFAADFTTGAIRNTLSWQSDRRKVYLAKLLLSVVICLILTGICLLSSWLIGGMLFGFAGMSAAYLLHTLVMQLLLFPVQLGILGFVHCVIACTKKSSSTIAVYLLVLIFFSLVLQLMQNFSFSIAGTSISFAWLALLDWNVVGRLLLDYPAMSPAELLTVVAGGLAIAAAATALGVTRYRRTDIT